MLRPLKPGVPLPTNPPTTTTPCSFRRGWAKQVKLADASWRDAWLRSRAKQERWEASIQRRAERLARREAWAEWQAQRQGQLEPEPEPEPAEAAVAAAVQEGQQQSGAAGAEPST